MKLWTLTTFCAASLLVLSGCSGATPKPKEEMTIDNTLPMVTLTQNGTVVDMKAIAFEWKSITDPRVQGIYIYKKSPSTEEEPSKLEYHKTLESRFTTHYVDTDINPDKKYSYAFKTFSEKAEGKLSRVVVLNSLPVLESVSWIHSVTGMPRSAKIIWRPHNNKKVKLYVIERKTLGDESWSRLATVDGRLNAEYIDLDLKDNYVYNYRVRVLTYDEILSSPSQIVKVMTKALPKGVSEIKATKTLPKKIKLTWEKTQVKDFALYYVYRSESIDDSYELVAKLHNNRFEEKIEEDGKSYFYRVSVVDKDGLESHHEKISVQGMTLQKPDAPAVVKANIVGNNIEITWSSIDKRSKTFTVTKSYQKSWIDTVSEDFEGIKGQKFVDKEILPDSVYSYMVYGVDANGIKSEPSFEIKIKTKESNKIIPPSKKEVKMEVIDAPVQESEPQEMISPVQDLDLNEI
ncbi:MAG: hypothetical protein U9Q40_08075 [Campylobacterota bacterium]|nr:hypothetical protein [Campylobacterota bacterium]